MVSLRLFVSCIGCLCLFEVFINQISLFFLDFISVASRIIVVPIRPNSKLHHTPITTQFCSSYLYFASVRRGITGLSGRCGTKEGDKGKWKIFISSSDLVPLSPSNFVVVMCTKQGGGRLSEGEGGRGRREGDKREVQSF